MDAFIARQAIFDRKQTVFGYELLFRSCPQNSFDLSDGNLATSQVISNSLLTIGLDRLLSGRRAFINFGRDLLIQDLTASLPKDRIVVEVLETVEADSDVLAACRQLKERGYMIALDDFVCHTRSEALSKYADIVKVDFRATSRGEQQNMVRRYSKMGIKMLAEKVETYEEYQWSREAGYEYFQGYFFSRPTVLQAKQIHSSTINTLGLLQELQKIPLDYQSLCRIIMRDVSFSYKLLRYINSGAFHFRAPINSITQALIMLGDDEIRRWTTLVVLPGMARDKPEELVSHALVRARFCELLGQSATPSCTSVDAFLTGMFSLLDAIVDRPLSEIVGELKLSGEMRAALLHTATDSNVLAVLLRLVFAYETAHWPEVKNAAERVNVSSEAISNFYVESVAWRDHLIGTIGIA